MARTQRSWSAGIDRAGSEPAVVAAGRGPRVLGRWGVAVVCVGLALWVLAGPAWAAKDDLDLVSRAAGATAEKGNSFSFQPAVSADGRFVVFLSSASNLHPDDVDTILDVFVRDLQAGTVTLVSRAAGAAGDKGNNFSSPPAVSADGRFVAFRSDASNLHPDDGDDTGDVFVRDLEANTVTLVSRAAGATGDKGNFFSFEPAVSADGRFVAFASSASNLHPDDDDATADVFVRDLVANTVTLVSRAAGATGDEGNASSFAPAVSADGRFVAFESDASNLHPDDDDATADVFVRDLVANTVTLVSRAAGATGAKGNFNSFQPAVSADGRFVAFESFASNLHPDDGDDIRDVFVRDLVANTVTLVSRAAGATGAKGNEISVSPAVSADGRFVAFRSDASNLHPDDGDDTGDVFVRDLVANTVTLVSRAAGATGAKGNNPSSGPAVSADGRFVAFESDASNLHPDDPDGVLDVFRRDVLGPPPAPVAEQPPLLGQAPPGGPPAGPAGPAQPGCPLVGTVVVGGAGADVRSGGALSDIIFGALGDDLLRGLGGADCLYGQRGADRLLGGRGRDRLFGGPGPDRLSGGAGNDRLHDRLGRDRLVGLAGRDRLWAGPGADRLLGGPGGDRVNPGRGRDRVTAGPGNDRVLARGLGSDTIDCGPGAGDVAIVDPLDQTRRCEQVRLP